VISCKHCGAQLPDDARFCLQCGNRVANEANEAGEAGEAAEPVEQPQPAGEPTGRPVKASQVPLDFAQPALTGGMFLGVLSSVPFIQAGNLFCCMWVLLGGGIAAIMVVRQRPAGITYGDGAFVGVLSGLFGAVVGTILQMSFRAIASRFFESQQQQLEQMLTQIGAEGPMRDWVLRSMSGEISATTVTFTFFANVIAYSLFAMIGGILTIALLNRRKARGR
jgi:hypothetical protein